MIDDRRRDRRQSVTATNGSGRGRCDRCQQRDFGPNEAKQEERATISQQPCSCQACVISCEALSNRYQHFQYVPCWTSHKSGLPASSGQRASAENSFAEQCCVISILSYSKCRLDGAITRHGEQETQENNQVGEGLSRSGQPLLLCGLSSSIEGSTVRLSG